MTPTTNDQASKTSQRKPSLWFCECGAQNEMPTGLTPGGAVTCSKCALTLNYNTGTAASDAQKQDQQIAIQDNWMPGVHEKHMSSLASAYLPAWATTCRCPVCDKPLGVNGVRGIGVKLTAQHFGDIVVDGQCDACDSGFDTHFRKACRTADGLGRALRNATIFYEHPDDGTGEVSPVPLHQITPDKNNTTDAMAGSSRTKVE